MVTTSCPRFPGDSVGTFMDRLPRRLRRAGTGPCRRAGTRSWARAEERGVVSSTIRTVSGAECFGYAAA